MTMDFKRPYDFFLMPNGIAILGVDEKNRQILSVGWKETYHIEENGACILEESQEPFNFEIREDIDGPDSEPEFFPYKLTTDVVVYGNAWAPNSKEVTRMVAAVQLGDSRKEVLVVGDRKCSYRKGTYPLFSEPEPFQCMPITYKKAYGGVAPTDVPPLKTLMDFVSPYPGAYPRNDIGRGYVIHNEPDFVEGLSLPNIEDPLDLITPERLIVGKPENWWRQPLPQSFEWYSPGWYPRIVHLGCVPDGLPEDDSVVPEVERGYLWPGHAKFCREAPLEERLLLSFTSGASPGLSFQYLRGDETIVLEGMRPQGTWPISLPGTTPEILLVFEGISQKLPVVLQTVLIKSEEAKLTLVWRGHWYPTRGLPLRLPSFSEPSIDPIEGIKITVNGERLH